MEIKFDDHQEWHGKYNGIPFEIVKWKRDGDTTGYHWNFYLFVKPRKLKTAKGFREGTRRVDYSKMYDDVEMHGGITYWSRHRSSSMAEADKIGCDYAHSWDMDEACRRFLERNVEMVMDDVKKSIDVLPKDLFHESPDLLKP